MQNRGFNQLTENARSLADRIGAETTEALIRATSGVERTATEGVSALQKGQEAVTSGGQQLGSDISRGIQTLATPKLSARVAWRAGRFVGRVEGAVRLAAFGVRFWWRRRQRDKHEQPGGQARQTWMRPLIQWGPAVVASVYLVIQLGASVRRKRVEARA